MRTVKQICITITFEEERRLEAMVAEAQDRGWVRANKSHMLRIALKRLDLDALLDELAEKRNAPEAAGAFQPQRTSDRDGPY